MKRKILIALLAVVAVFACAFGLTACGDKDNDGENNVILVNGLYLLDNGDSYTVNGVKDTNLTEAVIPDQYDGKPVTSICDYAFNWCRWLESITIPDSVTSICDYAFNWCSSLTSVTIPDSVTSIGENAFIFCKLLEYNLYGNALYLGNGSNPYLALVGVRDIEDINECTINEKTKVIANGAFFNCDSLKSITVEEGNVYFHSSGNCLIETQSKILIAGCYSSVIPVDGSVTAIGDGAFYGCSSLESITIPDGVTEIGDHAFYDCIWLKSITIPDSVISIGDYAFCGCGELTSITLPDGVEKISNELFSDCDSLTTVTIPNSVTSIGYSVFYDCTSLTDINFKGTRSEWTAISKGSSWNSFTGNYAIHCTDGDIAKQ